MDFVATWNIHDKDDKYFNLENRTNNAFECYNRSVDNKLPAPHPYLLVFFKRSNWNRANKLRGTRTVTEE